MDINSGEVKAKWKNLKASSGFHNVVLFLEFVAVSALFWLILALNDSAQNNFNVKVAFTNVPDTVTFISDIPEKIHVSVRDKGTNLWRNGILRHPTLSINFKEYADAGVLRFTKNDMLSSLKTVFGSTAQITALSTDSIHLIYTTNKGKRVPVIVDAKIMAASGSIQEGEPKCVPTNVLVYAEQDVLDTIYTVETEILDLQDLSETTQIDANLKKIRGARILPSQVKVTVPIEPLVKKQALITITPANVPKGESLLLFPSKVPVQYYVAMSRLGDNDDPSIELQVDYDQIAHSSSGRLHVSVVRYPDRLLNLSLQNDSVEYTIVKN
ncbi:MAG: YbbR-like domain-containing protein [Muribaculaceae bacterium]|nr:YbbR-like domain-containing protein [Muribaculaceae bacterium]